jgi:hypothetical protein
VKAALTATQTMHQVLIDGINFDTHLTHALEELLERVNPQLLKDNEYLSFRHAADQSSFDSYTGMEGGAAVASPSPPSSFHGRKNFHNNGGSYHNQQYNNNNNQPRMNAPPPPFPYERNGTEFKMHNQYRQRDGFPQQQQHRQYQQQQQQFYPMDQQQQQPKHFNSFSPHPNEQQDPNAYYNNGSPSEYYYSNTSIVNVTSPPFMKPETPPSPPVQSLLINDISQASVLAVQQPVAPVVSLPSSNHPF